MNKVAALTQAQGEASGAGGSLDQGTPWTHPCYRAAFHRVHAGEGPALAQPAPNPPPPAALDSGAKRARPPRFDRAPPEVSSPPAKRARSTRQSVADVSVVAPRIPEPLSTAPPAVSAKGKVKASVPRTAAVWGTRLQPEHTSAHSPEDDESVSEEKADFPVSYPGGGQRPPISVRPLCQRAIHANLCSDCSAPSADRNASASSTTVFPSATPASFNAAVATLRKSLR